MNALVSDFDGTITEVDFYILLAQRYMPPNTPDAFAAWRAGRITHFDAMQSFFRYAPSNHAALERLLEDTRPDPRLKESVRRLEEAGWELIIVSAGSAWYIERILAAAGVSATVHANPGRIENGRGLVMRRPEESRFYSPKVGIDKPAVVRDALRRYEQVAFAGDGPPDLEAALEVEPGLRFARGVLAETLRTRREGYRPFKTWSDVVDALV